MDTIHAKELEIASLKAELQKNKNQIDPKTNSTNLELERARMEKDQYEFKFHDVEGRLKTTQMELECQRNHAEAARLLLEKKLKEQERDLLRDLHSTQSDLNALEKKFQDSQDMHEAEMKTLTKQADILNNEKL